MKSAALVSFGRRGHKPGMNIILNGEPHETAATTIAALVKSLSLDTAKVAVERNLVLVPRSLHAATPVEGGDRVEVVQFVGGG